MNDETKLGLGLFATGLFAWAFWPKVVGAFKGSRADVTLTEKDTGSTVTVKAGSTIAVVLMTNPSTGYSWQPATDRYPLGQPVLSTAFTNPSLVGSPVIETRVYKTTPSMIGSHRVYLEYKRSFEQVASAKVFYFDAVVTN